MKPSWRSPLTPLEAPRQPHPSDERQKQQYAAGGPRRASRRDVLRLLGATTAAAAGTGAAWLWLRDPTGRAARPETAVVRLPAGGFAVPALPGMPELAIVRGRDPLPMMRACLQALGGVRRFVASGDTVVVKPNVAFDRAPVLGATTNPEALAALVAVLRDGGAREVRVVDNPINSPEGSFHKSGIAEAARRSGARLMLPDPAHFRTLAVDGAELIARWPMLYRPFVGATKVIGIAPLKDHNLCSASMTMKNWYGLLGGRRNQFHQRIHEIVAELALMMRPTLVILDATRVLMSNGPTGGSLSDVKPMDTMVLATDQLAADAYGYEMLLERDPSRLPYLQLAEARGVGTRQWRRLRREEIQV